MNRKVIFLMLMVMGIFLIFSITFNPSQVLCEDSLAKLEVREKRAASKLTVFSHQRAEESRIVEALPVLRSAEEEAILNELKEARKSGDTDTAGTLQSRLDALHGIVPNVLSEGAYEVQGQVSLEAPSQGPGVQWVEGDILITNPTIDQAYDLARRCGAVGGKITGAGGGGFLMLYSEPEYQLAIREALEQKGFKSMAFHFEYSGAIVLMNAAMRLFG